MTEIIKQLKEIQGKLEEIDEKLEEITEGKDTKKSFISQLEQLSRIAVMIILMLCLTNKL